MIKIGEWCVACEQCADVCPMDAIKVGPLKATIDYMVCVECGECIECCPMYAIKEEPDHG